jgi:3-hydroxyacyl-CoA dehydrogenase
MGSRIAAHLANAGLTVVLLDIPSDGPVRSSIAAQALEGLKKAKPAAFFEPSLAARISVGNFDDNLAMLADCDCFQATRRRGAPAGGITSTFTLWYLPSVDSLLGV